MTRPKLLDLFCCAGGAAAGYAQAGFDITGVDNRPQPRYPYPFIQANALDILNDQAYLDTFDAVHASPPCQAHTAAQVLHGRHHPDLLPPTLAALNRWGGLWVVENVAGAPMPGALQLCGTEFGLGAQCQDGTWRQLRRHRLFLSNLFLMGAGGCHHTAPAISVFGHGGPRTNPNSRAVYQGTIAERRAAMGINWTNRDELSESIPPAYTRFIGEQLLAHLTAERAA